MENKKGQKRKTAGQISLELRQRAAISPTNTDPQAQTNMHLSDYEKNILECAQNFAQKNPNIDFFIDVRTKKEKLMQNILRNYFMAKFACPTPDYDQAVFHFDHQTEDINLVWIIPDQQSCFHIKENILNNPPDMKELVQYVLDFADGTLLKKAKALNNEKLDVNPILEFAEGAR